MLRIHTIIGAFLCLSIFLSCEKKPETPVLPTETTRIASDGLVGLDQLMPDLVTLECIRYDEQLGYCVSFDELQEWEHIFATSPVFIPAQTVPGAFEATRPAIPEASGWEADVARQVILSDIGIPGGSSSTDLIQGACDGVFGMKSSLGENVPYRKVTLAGLEVAFPEWFRAEAESGNPELEVTAEGATVGFRLHSIQEPARFTDEEGRLCFSLDLSFRAHVSVRPEDYVGPGPEMPSELDFRCSFEFDRIDFTSCDLQYTDVYFSEDRMSYVGVLPGFFCGEGSDIRFTSPRLLIDYGNDIPFTSSRVDAVAFYDDEFERPTVAFSLSGDGKYLYLPKDDGIHREGIQTVVIGEMDKLFSSPFPGGTLFARLLLQPVFSTYGTFVPGQEYLMYAKPDWTLPLAFLGHPTNVLESPPLVMEGDVLKAPPGCTHQITQEISGNLPFDCRITPVFSVDREEPVFLDSFPLEKDKKVKVTHQFSPKEDHWKATLHYIVTPTQGKNEYFTKDYGLKLENTLFTKYFVAGQ